MNEELAQIYQEDIADRRRDEKDWNNLELVKEIKQRDRERKTKVQQLIDRGVLRDASDFHHAALIFQHGETSEDYKKAHELASKAVEMGDETARWLFAATEDRWLLSEGKPQKYGTQFKQNEQSQLELVQPIDPAVTDKERARCNVPPLKDALSAYKKKYRLK